MRVARRLVCLTLATGVVVAAGALPALAHPLGNFTTNSYLGVTVGEDRVTVDHVLDLAEIPTLQAMPDIDLDDDGTVDDAEAERHRSRTCASMATQVDVLLAGASARLSWSGDGELSFPPGEAGLDTLRLECTFIAEHTLDRPAQLTVDQSQLGGKIGWREITIAGDGVGVTDSDVPTQGISARLTAYPEDRLASPLDVTSATATLQPGGSGDVVLPMPAAVPDGISRGVDRVSRWFTGLVAVEDLTIPFALLAVVVATGLGTLHALAPGHGKTVMAAYLVGRQGTTRDALLLGGTVAVTHTFGVLLLGVLLSAFEAASPERIYPWLGAGSGLLFALVGVTLLRQALHGGHDHTHGPDGHHHGPGGHSHRPDADMVAVPTSADHGHLDGPDDPHHDTHATSTRESSLGHTHHHDTGDPGTGDDGIDHDHGGHDHGTPHRAAGWRGLLAPGLAGGLVPSPSALLVLLGGFAIGRAWFGVGLVVAYGVGMAATLVGAGYLLLKARHRIQRAVSAEGRWSRASQIFQWLPVATSAMIILGGLVIVGRSLLVL